jgi:hypothetical protein
MAGPRINDYAPAASSGDSSNRLDHKTIVVYDHPTKPGALSFAVLSQRVGYRAKRDRLCPFRPRSDQPDAHPSIFRTATKSSGAPSFALWRRVGWKPPAQPYLATNPGASSSLHSNLERGNPLPRIEDSLALLIAYSFSMKRIAMALALIGLGYGCLFSQANTSDQKSSSFSYRQICRVPHLRDGLIVAKVGIVRSTTVLPPTLIPSNGKRNSLTTCPKQTITPCTP